VADQILGKFMELADEDTNVVLCVASSMGQKPWIPASYGNVAPETCRIRSIERLVEILGIQDQCDFFSTMAPQWNIRISNSIVRKTTISHLHAARYQPGNKSMYSVLEVADSIVVTPVSHHGLSPSTICSFPTLEQSPRYPFSELVVQEDNTRKSGCHDPIGMLAFYGHSVYKHYDLGTVNILDIAPTLLALLGLPVPSYMRGRILTDVLR